MSVAEEEIVEMDGVKHLHGNLYRVRLDLIELPEASEEGVLTFKNPRLVGTNKPKGFSKEEMEELRKAIQTEGLEHPLLLRKVLVKGKSILQLVSGERRYRSISKLVKDKASCRNPATGKDEKASVLYEYVDARINLNMDDRTAYKHAYSGNDKAIGIGEGSTVALIREFREAGWTDQDVMEATGKSITWLKDTDILIDLDEDTFKALANDQINRSAALDLAKIEDVEERLQVLDRAREFATSRLSSVKKKLEKEVENTESKAEVAKAEIAEHEFTGNGEAKAKAESKAKKLESKAAQKRREHAEVDDGEPKVTGKDLQKARSTGKRSGESQAGDEKSLTKAKMDKCWYQPAKALVKSEGLDESGKAIENIELEDARLILLVCESFERGEKDVVKILKQHYTAKLKRAKAH